MRYLKNYTGLILLLAFGLILAAIAVGCAAGPEPMPKEFGASEKTITLEPAWVIKVPNSNTTRGSILEIYIVGDEFFPTLFWIREKRNHKLDDVERLAAIIFLRQKGVDIDNAEIKNEKKIMYIYPHKADAAGYEEHKEDVNNIIIGLDNN